jgi:glycosyltransferase involved in cell wall biosynthesis
MPVKRVAVDLRMVGATPHGIARYALGIWNGLPEADGLRFTAICSPEGFGRVAALRRGDEVVVAKAGFLSAQEQVELPWLLARARADLLHAPSFSVPMLWRGPLVLTLHDATHLALPAHASVAALLYHRTVVRDAARRAVKVLTVSEFSADQIARFYRVPSHRIVVAPDAVELDEPADTATLEVSQAPYLLYVGNGKPHKNVEVLVAARALLSNPPPLLLCGEGLARFAGPGIEVLGAVADAALSTLYRGAAIFLFPSLMEGFGLPPMEAAARGSALLLADSSALREIWAGVAPLLPAHDVAAWAQAISGLLADETARKALGELCRARAGRFQSWQPAVDAALGAYRLGLALAR